MTTEPPAMNVSSPRRGPWRNLSAVWLVPLLALIVSLGVAWRSYADRGVLVEIVFENAAGISAGETTLRYRDVVVGLVEKVGFSDDLTRVEVAVRVDTDLAEFISEDAQFWVVRPEVSAQGISGLSTVLSGVYIEGVWDAAAGAPARRFIGLEKPPAVRPGHQGKQVTLRVAEGGAVPSGAPILYKGIQVGRTDTGRLDETGAFVLVDAFIDAPHDRLLTSATRFWDTSGFSVSFGAGGLKLDVESLAALVTGGVSFDTFFDGAEVTAPGDMFRLFPDETAARESAFSPLGERVVRVSAVFEGGISGLSVGAIVAFEGLQIGRVEALSTFVVQGDEVPEVRQQVVLAIDPAQLGFTAEADVDSILGFLDAAIESGVRARLAAANLLSQALIVELVEIPGARGGRLNRAAQPYPSFPTVASNLPDLNATVEGVLKRVNALRIEDLIDQAIATLASIETIARDPDTRATPEALVQLLDETRAFVAGADVQALPGDLRATVGGVRAAVDTFNQAQAVENLVSALRNADRAASDIALAAEAAPELMAELRAVAAKANALPAEDLVASATRFLDSADAVIATEAARALPASVTGALDEIRRLVTELREGGAVENTNSALASAATAADAVERATADLPALTARLDQLLTRTDELIAAYGERSDFNDETLEMLRDVSDAARSVSNLTRALERNPNSILFGK